jgi:hypothetical protein
MALSQERGDKEKSERKNDQNKEKIQHPTH